MADEFNREIPEDVMEEEQDPEEEEGEDLFGVAWPKKFSERRNPHAGGF